MIFRIASGFGRGSLDAGTFDVQVFHWFYVGGPRATTPHVHQDFVDVPVLLSSGKAHLQFHSCRTRPMTPARPRPR